jgi:arylsulfatase
VSQPPANLLLISFDQWRGDWADPFVPAVELPALQSLAKRSVVARRCYTSSPQCVPARMSWLTGLAPSQMGVTRNTIAEAPTDAPSLFRKLQIRGWYTELIGKTHWTNHRYPTDLRKTQDRIKALGFNTVMEIAGPKALQHVRCALTDDWEKEGWMDLYIKDLRRRYRDDQGRQAWTVRPSVLPDELYPDLWLTERALEALQRMPTQQPWLLWVSFVGPHEPFDTPTKWNNRQPHKTPDAVMTADWYAQLPVHCELQLAHQRWRGKLTAQEIESCRQDYANHLQLLDCQLQRLLDALAARGDACQTAIAVTSDHGEMLGDHGMLYKGTFLEASIRVPFQYCPPPSLNNQPKALRRPVGLTNMFSTMLSNLVNGGHAKEIVQTAKKTDYVCVEFGDELLVIQNSRKLCRQLSGEILWATHLGQDPQ